MIGLEPCLELTGKDDLLEINLLHERGRVFFDFLRTEYIAFMQEDTGIRLVLHIPRVPFSGAEEDRCPAVPGAAAVDREGEADA